jgi:peroxiredoxin 2/4
VLKPGSKVQDFTVPAYSGGQKGKLAWSDYHGQWVVLFFYPFDFTGVCGSEVKGFNELYGEFERRGVRLVAASCDSVHSHEAWVRRDFGGDVKYPIIGDFTKAVATQFGVLADDKGCPYRVAFIIDQESTVRCVLANDLPVGRSTDEVLRLLDALMSGAACLLNWKPTR